MVTVSVRKLSMNIEMARERKYSSFRRNLRAQIRSHSGKYEIDEEDYERPKQRIACIASHALDDDAEQPQKSSYKFKYTSPDERTLHYQPRVSTLYKQQEPVEYTSPDERTSHYQPRVSTLYKQQEPVETCYDSALFQNQDSNNWTSASNYTYKTRASTLGESLGRRRLTSSSLNSLGWASTVSTLEDKSSKEGNPKIEEPIRMRMKGKKKSHIETKTVHSAQSMRSQKSPQCSQPRGKTSCASDSTYKQLTDKFHKHYKYFDDVLKNGAQVKTVSTASVSDEIDIDETVKSVLSKFCTKETKKHVFAKPNRRTERLKRFPSTPTMKSCSPTKEKVCSRRKRHFSKKFRKLLKRYEHDM